MSISMAFSSFFSLNFIPKILTCPAIGRLFPSNSHRPFGTFQYMSKKREFPLPSVASIPYQPFNVDYLEREFSGHGVTFESLDDICIANMVLDDRSTATLMLPSGLITSYKPQMWHGATQELLQTSVIEGEDGSAAIQGGVSLAFNFEDGGGEIPWSPCSWSLRDIRGNSYDSIQIELMSTDAVDMVEVRYIISLKHDNLSSEIAVRNVKSSSIKLTGSIITHLTVSTPEATYAYGLEGSNFYNRPMVLSSFSIVPPESGQADKFGFGKLWGNERLKGFWSGWNATNRNNADETKTGKIRSEEEMEGEEKDNYKHLTEKMSRIYTSAPRDFTVIDRGRRNSVVIGRDGFAELYMFSPGSSHQSYGLYSYICVGQSAMLKPVVLSPGDVWRGEQRLQNPNQ